MLTALGKDLSGDYKNGGDTRFFAMAPIESTKWKVVLSERRDVLLPGLGGSKQWVLYGIFVALILSGLAALFFLRRAMIGEAHLVRKQPRTGRSQHDARRACG